MKTKILFAVLLFVSIIIAGQVPKVKTGIEVLRDSDFKILEGKKVGLVTNASGVDHNLKSTVDILFDAESINLVALYGPEHGVRGNIEGGDAIDFYVDEFTNLPVYSLYGRTERPNEEMLKNIDVLVYDIQDIGCRSYTFISTMGLVMEAAAKFNKEVVVLDRPNPLGGNRIEGNYVEDEFISFISQFKIPYVYGLTCGELAKVLNNEAMLEDGSKCNLTVIPMQGWKRDMTFEETGLPWVPTSPHIPHKDSPFYYVASGIVGELRNAVSIGVGYTIPFQAFAAQWIDGNKLAEKMNSFKLEGVLFRPIYYKPYYAFGKEESLFGVQIHITNFKTVDLMQIEFRFLEALKELYPDRDLFEMASRGQVAAVDKALGTNNVREKFIVNYKYKDVEEYLNKDVEAFRSISKKYYLYE
ncbi:MAG: DUF1343 domain-containing protein [Bacteroidetes bacterium]|nr:DUF1343 domain-containing protein [Bacteroidota bacterium]